MAAPTSPLPAAGFAAGPVNESAEDTDDSAGDTQALDGQAKEPVSWLFARLGRPPRGLSSLWPYLFSTSDKMRPWCVWGGGDEIKSSPLWLWLVGAYEGTGQEKKECLLLTSYRSCHT